MQRNFNLRNITPEVMQLLKKEALNQNTSVNSIILQILDKSLGIVSATKKTTYHDLDHLAGTWSLNDQETFENNIKSFEEIDQELW